MASASPAVSISEIIFSDGSAVKCSPSDVLVLVGPNNSGKSEALRGVRDKLTGPAHANPVISRVSSTKSGSPADLLAWLGEWAPIRRPGTPGGSEFGAFGLRMHQNQCTLEWQLPDGGLGSMCRWFCYLLEAEERLDLGNPASNISLTQEPPTHPIHFLLRDDQIEGRLSARFRRAFGHDLIVHRNAGSTVPLYVGKRPVPVPPEDRVSLSYIERLEKLPTLRSQGDGMRSFAGVILATSVGRESILLIDEPEAFLHPPQARLLGLSLVQERGCSRQLFVATHSADVLRGMLDSGSPDVRVVRITRRDAVNIARVLDNARIGELWGDPLLRYSNILDGLFHDGVVVCEGDADCRFYSAVHDSMCSAAEEGTRRPDVMFTHCGGKARLAVVIRALREVDVPVRAVADFDILSEEQPLREVIEALGLAWSDVAGDWKLVKSAIDGKKPELSTTEVSEKIHSVLSRISEATFPGKAKDEIQSVLRRSSPWSNAKDVGKAFVPPGGPTKACERLLRLFRGSGLYVVEVGELESFVRSEGGHGPKWVNAVQGRDLLGDPELETARTFVQELMQFGTA